MCQGPAAWQFSSFMFAGTCPWSKDCNCLQVTVTPSIGRDSDKVFASLSSGLVKYGLSHKFSEKFDNLIEKH